MALCLLTPEAEYDVGRAEWMPQAALLEHLFDARGIKVSLLPWTTDADLSGFALAIPLMAWGYHRDITLWLAQLDRWAACGARLVNPLPVLRWNADKAYLLDFEQRGVAIVPSRIAPALTANDLASARTAFGCERLVVKPVSSASSHNTFLLGSDDALPAEVAGERMLIQPMMAAIESEGEYSLFYLGGRYSHAIVKRPRAGEFRCQSQFGGRHNMIDAPEAAHALADAALTASGPDIAYARIDLIGDGMGGYALMEIELIEPYLYLDQAPDGGAGFIDMVTGMMAWEAA
ncbi:MAG: RimK family alpha-L-glutamate ligase [Sphingomonas sp.]